MTNKEKRLLEIISKLAYQYSPTPKYKLASGKISHYYIDCKSVIMSPDGLILCGQVIFEKIQELNIDAIGGLEFGAIPIALSAVIFAYQNGIKIKPFVVRKQEKNRGLIKSIEGKIEENDRVIIVEDVITSGTSALMAAERVKEKGAKIIKVVALVDRVEGGMEALQKNDIELDAIFKLNDLNKHLGISETN